MYNPFKTILPFVSYIAVNNRPEGVDIPDLSEYEPKVVVVEKPKQESVKVETSAPSQATPREIKIDTEAYTPAEETLKTGTVSHVVQNPYQSTDAPKGNFNFRTPGKIIINDGVKLTDEHKQILAELSKLGISGTVSSGIREGVKTAQGKTSFHAVGQAFDFVPSAKYTSEQFKELLLTSGAYDYVKSLGYNILDETNPEIMKKTGATGPHFHFGKDPVKAESGIKFISEGIADSRNFFQRLFDTHPHPTSGPVDLDELKRRQAWAESNNNPKAVSGAGAVGTYQIMPSVKKEYVKRTGHKGRLTDPAYNEQVRDWYFNERIPEHYFVNAGNPTDSIRVAKQLAAYNAGPNSVMNKLVKAKKEGVDIYKTFDWLPYIPKETRDYVEFILRNKDTGGNRTNTAYKKHMK